MSHSIRLALILSITVIVASACTSISLPEPETTLEQPKKILSIGNGLTHILPSIDVHFERLSGSATPPLVIEIDRVGRSSSPLEMIWKHTDVGVKISEGDYDIVLLQEDLGITDVESFHESVRKFDAAIKEKGAETVLFMAWPYETQVLKITMEEITQAHHEISAELGLEIAPVGLAWQRAMAERPDLNMYTYNMVNPSVHGAYLAANVIFATVFDRSPVGLDYLPSEYPGVTEEEAVFLQRIAWETVKEY